MRPLLAVLLLPSCTTTDPALRLVVHQLFPPDQANESSCYVECADTGPAPPLPDVEDTGNPPEEWSGKLSFPLCNPANGSDPECALVAGVSRLHIVAQLVDVTLEGDARPEPPTLAAVLDAAELSTPPSLNRRPLGGDENPYYEGSYRIPSGAGGRLVFRGNIGALEAATTELPVAAPTITVAGECPGGCCATGVGAATFEFQSSDPSITKLRVVQRLDDLVLKSEELPLKRSGTGSGADASFPVPPFTGNWTVQGFADGLPDFSSLTLPVAASEPMTLAVLVAPDQPAQPVMRARNEPAEECRTLTVRATATTPTASGRVEVSVQQGMLDAQGQKVLGRLEEANSDANCDDRALTSEHTWTLPSGELPASATVTIRDPADQVDGATTTLSFKPVLPATRPPGDLAATLDSFRVGTDGSPKATLFGQFYAPPGATLTDGLSAFLVVNAEPDTSVTLPCSPTPTAAIRCDSANLDLDITGGGCALTGPTATLDRTGRFEVPLAPVCFAGTVTIRAYTARLALDATCLGERSTTPPQANAGDLVLNFTVE